jgi:hypothetical protein
MMRYWVAIAIVIAVVVAWRLIFRAAMKYPNRGNEFSRENVERGGGPHIV